LCPLRKGDFLDWYVYQLRNSELLGALIGSLFLPALGVFCYSCLTAYLVLGELYLAIGNYFFGKVCYDWCEPLTCIVFMALLEVVSWYFIVASWFVCASFLIGTAHPESAGGKDWNLASYDRARY
jgi:RsiW-degrading membrane proteinase PrsW (M82 family)